MQFLLHGPEKQFGNGMLLYKNAFKLSKDPSFI